MTLLPTTDLQLLIQKPDTWAVSIILARSLALFSMWSCNACPVRTEISPTTRAGCGWQISCNATERRDSTTRLFSACCSSQISCNATLTPGALSPSPVPGVRLPPPLHPLGVLLAAEVAGVLRSAQPAPLAGALRGLPAGLLRAGALAARQCESMQWHVGSHS